MSELRCLGAIVATVLGPWLVAGCSAGDDSQDVTVQDVAGYPASVAVSRVRQRIARADYTVEVTRDGETLTLTSAYLGGWRAHRDASQDRPEQTMVTDGDLVCFDKGGRSPVMQALTMSYGTARFDPEPWSCTPYAFGLNPVLVAPYVAANPRTRVAQLADPATDTTGEVVDVGDTPLVVVRPTGVTADGLQSPEWQPYRLWVDADLRLVQMASRGLVWRFTYPDDAGDVADQVALPPEDDRGSYGYALGPGGAAVKGCIYWNVCPDAPSIRLSWGDGRESAASRRAD